MPRKSLRWGIDAGNFRKLSKPDLAKIGASPKSERYVRASSNRITRSTTTISRRAYEQASKAVKRQGSDVRSCQTMATMKAARQFAATFERLARDRRITRLHPPPLHYRIEAHSRSYRLIDEMRSKLADLRMRKLAGEYLDLAEWKALVDFARTVNDPALSRLLKARAARPLKQFVAQHCRSYYPRKPRSGLPPATLRTRTARHG